MFNEFAIKDSCYILWQVETIHGNVRQVGIVCQKREIILTCMQIDETGQWNKKIQCLVVHSHLLPNLKNQLSTRKYL